MEDGHGIYLIIGGLAEVKLIRSIFHPVVSDK